MDGCHDVLVNVYLEPIEAAGERRRHPHFGANVCLGLNLDSCPEKA